MNKIKLRATTTFGLEAVAKREIEKLGFTDIKVSDGYVEYTADYRGIVQSIIWLRTADKVILVIEEFET